MNARARIGLIVLVVIAVAMGWNLGRQGKIEGIAIGFVSTFSGGSAAIGQDMKDAFELALDGMGRKMGGQVITVVYEDDAQDPAVGLQKTQRLVQQEHAKFVTGFIWSNVLLASAPAAVDNNVFLVSANAGPAELAGAQCKANFFSTSWQNDQTPMAMGDVLNRTGVKNLYVLAPNYAAGKNMITGLQRGFKGTVVATALTQFPEQLDFSAELAKIRAANPEAVWVFFPGNYGTQFFTQYAAAGLLGKIPLYSTFSIDALNLQQIGPLVTGSRFTQSWAADLDNPANAKFVADFRAKFGRTPSFYAAQAYDSALLIRSAVEAVKGDVTNMDAVRAALRKAAFSSVRGGFKFGQNQLPIQNFYLNEVVKGADGKFASKVVETVYRDNVDPYAGDCPMHW